MKNLKEALIGKNTIKNAEVLSSLYCVANYDDDLDLVGDDVVTVRSKDWVTIHILRKEAMNKHLKEIDDMLCDTWNVKDPKLSIEDVKKKIISNTWRKDLDRKLCEQVYLRTIKEALIGKHNIDKASADTLWVTSFKKKDIVPGTIAKIYDDDDGESVYLYVPACALTGFDDQFIQYNEKFVNKICGWKVKFFNKDFPHMDIYSDVVINAIISKPVDVNGVTTALDVKNILEKIVH